MFIDVFHHHHLLQRHVVHHDFQPFPGSTLAHQLNLSRPWAFPLCARHGQQAEAVEDWSQVTIFIQPGVKPDPQVTFSLTFTCSLMALRLECSWCNCRRDEERTNNLCQLCQRYSCLTFCNFANFYKFNQFSLLVTCVNLLNIFPLFRIFQFLSFLPKISLTWINFVNICIFS